MCDYSDKLWNSDPEILFKKWYMIFPSSLYTPEQNVNSAVRFIIICSSILTMVNKDYKYLIIGTIMFLSLTLFYHVFRGK